VTLEGPTGQIPSAYLHEHGGIVGRSRPGAGLRGPNAAPCGRIGGPGSVACGGMNHRFLGRSGLKVSEIAYGNWVTHGEQIDDAAADKVVRAALDLGITTFDTADAYAGTRAEEVLGAALAGERREGLEIATKVFWPTGSGPNDRGLSRKHLMEAIDGSLRRLRTDHVDLYQAHRYDHQTPLEETMLAFADIVRAGKALYIGVSEWRAGELRAAAALAGELHVPLISNQPQYSALYRVPEAEVIPTSRELGIGQIVWSPLAQGALTGKYRPGQAPPAGSRGDAGGGTVADRFLRDDVLTRVGELRPLAAEAGLTPAQLAIAWVLGNDNVAAAIVGATRPEQLEDNAGASGVVLDDELRRRMDEILEPVVERDPALTASPPTRP
jgi:aryl-alcohol dehydrogenase-like predicted oxidoreductase